MGKSPLLTRGLLTLPAPAFLLMTTRSALQSRAVEKIGIKDEVTGFIVSQT
jgi:hypothetical protein